MKYHPLCVRYRGHRKYFSYVTAWLLCDSSDEVPKAAKLPKEHKTPKAPKEPKERRRVISAADEEAECAQQRARGLSGGVIRRNGRPSGLQARSPST